MSSKSEVFLPPTYEFLSRPPPSPKQRQLRQRGSVILTPRVPFPVENAPTRPTAPSLYLTRRTPTSNISSWASKVQPGSPVPPSPPSAPCHPPNSFRPLPRCASLSHLNHRPSIYRMMSRVPSGPFLNLMDSPNVFTPLLHECPHDLTALGYHYAVVKLPTPTTPSPSLKDTTSPELRVPRPIHVPSSPALTACEPSRKPFITRFRIRSRSKSASGSPAIQPSTPKINHPLHSPITKPHSPKHTAHRHRSKSLVSGKRAASLSKEKTYPRRPRAKHVPPPLPLECHLALTQFLDGGCREDNIKTLMQETAKRNGEKAVGGPYRDQEGVIWADVAEKMEYEPLIDEKACRHADGNSDQWLEFGKNSERGSGTGTTATSLRMASTVDSDLDPRYLMPIEYSMDSSVAVHIPPLSSPSQPSSPSIRITPGRSLLAIPTRSRRTALHLRKPASYVTDAFGPRSPRSPHSSHSARSPRSPRFPRSPHSPSFSPYSSSPRPRPKGKARRRPAPLTIVPPRVEGMLPTNSPIHVQPWLLRPVNRAVVARERDAFIEDSFRPAEPASQADMEVNFDVEVAGRAKGTGHGGSTLRNKAPRVHLNLGCGGGIKGSFWSRMGRKETGRVDS